MKQKQNRGLFVFAIAAVATLSASGCALETTKNAAAARSAVVNNGNCGPGTFAAIESAKTPTNARPGSPAIYQDCHH